MKQRITGEQLHELSGSKKLELQRWLHQKWYDEAHELDPTSFITINTPTWSDLRLTIGQMIELLDEHVKANHLFYKTDHGAWALTDVFEYKMHEDELCDLLWEAVKSVLEEE